MSWRTCLCCAVLLAVELISTVSCNECDHQCQTEDDTDGWFPALMVCNVEPRNATLIWTHDENTANASYTVLYEDATGNEFRSDPINGDEETFTHIITSLTPQTEYDVQVCQRELNTCGNCKVTFTTPAAEEPSGPPVGLVISVSGPSLLSISWSPPILYPEVVLTYVVQCVPQIDDPEAIETSRMRTRFDAVFHDLIPNTTYNCEVYTTSAFGNSSSAMRSATTLPRETVPGLMFFVSQNRIYYTQLTESSLQMFFFTFLDDVKILINSDELTANITGVDYHFQQKELYLTLSNGSILQYMLSVSSQPNGELSIDGISSPTLLYTAMEEYTLGAIAVDWLFNSIYWVEFKSSATKVYRMNITDGDVVCEVTCESQSIDKIALDPVHGYFYWSVHGDSDSNGLFRWPLGVFRNSLSSDCLSGTQDEEQVFPSATLVDFVLEPDVFIYFISDGIVNFIGFDKQNHGSISTATGMLVESFGEKTVSYSTFAQACSAETGTCLQHIEMFIDDSFSLIDDMLVFRKAKQPLPAPPSFPADVRVFSRSNSATITWKMPSFAQTLFGSSAYDDWIYCVNYTTIEGLDVMHECTTDLEVNLPALSDNTLYKFVVSASGPGGERTTPDEYLFRTKPAGSDTARLLISTDAAVMVSNLDGSGSEHLSDNNEIRLLTKESNGVAYDFRSSLYFWIIQGGQGPLYRYSALNNSSSELVERLDTPVSIAADWVGRRIFWVQDGMNVADDRQLLSINMDGGESYVFSEDPRISSIAVDSLNGLVFWITGKDVVAKKLNGLVKRTCFSADSELLALTVDVESQHLYLMTFNDGDNTVSLHQLNYSTEECSTSPYEMKLSGNLFTSSSRGVLTYGLGTLYLTTISSTSQSVYVIPADFASFYSITGDRKLTPAFGIIAQTDVVRDICVVSDILQPLPDGVMEPGLSSITAEPLSSPPRLDESRSNLSVIVIEWGVSPTNVLILYEVEYTLTPFRQSPMNTVKEFTTETYIHLENQTFFTNVVVTVTPHTLWVQSSDDLAVTSTFSSLPMKPGKVTNVRVYVYHPSFENRDAITALVVWNALTEVEAGGIVNSYSVIIDDADTFETTGNESYLVVRQFSNDLNKLSYPLQENRNYSVEVVAVNAGGTGIRSDLLNFSTNSASLSPGLLVVSNRQSYLYKDNGVYDTLFVTGPVTVNTISRIVYWYNATQNSLLMKSLDGDKISALLQDCPVNISTLAFEWQGERLYMAGVSSMTNAVELWRVPVVYSLDLERVYQFPMNVQSVTNLVVDSFRQGRAFWLQNDMTLEFLNLTSKEQERVNLFGIVVSAIALEPITGELWISNKGNGTIFKCFHLNLSCEQVVDTGMTVSSVSLDESMVYWTNGSVFGSVIRANPTSVLSISAPSEEDSICSLHALSPAQQPQFYSCDGSTTCLAPTVIPSATHPVAMYNTTNTSITVWWSLYSLPGCCYDTVFSYPLTRYYYGLSSTDIIEVEDRFRRHFTINDLKTFTEYTLFLTVYNIYTMIPMVINPRDIVTEWETISTSPGVPDEVDTLNADPFGVTCIAVSWSGPDSINGPPDSRTYFVTYLNAENAVTLDVGSNMSASLETIIPDVNYTIQIKVSNGVQNSSVVARDNVVSWPLVPAPEVQQKTNMSATLLVELGTEHSNITSLYIEAVTMENDGVNQSCCNEVINATLPTTLVFTVSGLSAYTLYHIRTRATYEMTTCSTNVYPGVSVPVRTRPGLPDTPELSINNEIAQWNAVNKRTNTNNFSYIFEAESEGEVIISVDVGNTVSQSLVNFNLLQAGQTYNICVIARNEIGNSTPSCSLYKHMPETSDRSLGLSLPENIAIGFAAAVLLVVLFLLVLTACWCRRKQKKALARLAYAYGPDLELSSIRAQRYYRTNVGDNQASMWSRETFVATDEELALLSKFPRKHITLENFLGQGEFGEVFQGTAFDILGVDTGPHPVAIKTFRKGATVEEKHKFLSEAALMGKFDHPNIVKILGICIDNDPVFIIMELMPAGDLLKFLREARPESGPALLTREEQLIITKDIAQGCRYLEQQHFIHRDLAARNCLVSSKGADRIVKIGDFGLARDLYSSDYYRVEGERKLPVRWMAPEALLQGKFTIESDVWAYGVLLYEVMSFGNQPYPGQSNQDVLQFVTAGGRLPKPDNCPQRFYRLMMMCWRKYASERPRFEEICRYLDTIIEDMKRESYCESDSDEGETLSREGSKRFPSRSPSFKSGLQNLVRSGSKKLRNSLRRNSMHRKEEHTTHTSVSSCANLIPTENGDSFRESGLI